MAVGWWQAGGGRKERVQHKKQKTHVNVGEKGLDIVVHAYTLSRYIEHFLRTLRIHFLYPELEKNALDDQVQHEPAPLNENTTKTKPVKTGIRKLYMNY